MSDDQQVMPSEGKDEKIGFFDRFATKTSKFVSKGPFFAFCVLLVVAWMIEGIVKATLGEGPKALLDDKYQLQINTTTTIITFLMVAILQNSQSRFENATSKKLNAMADAIADLLDHQATLHDTEECRALKDDARELREAVGLEHRESA